MGMPKYEYMPCKHCQGTGRNPKNRKKECPECNGDKHSNLCLYCRREIYYLMGCIVEGNSREVWEKERCKCYDIPQGCI